MRADVAGSGHRTVQGKTRRERERGTGRGTRAGAFFWDAAAPRTAIIGGVAILVDSRTVLGSEVNRRVTRDVAIFLAAPFEFIMGADQCFFGRYKL